MAGYINVKQFPKVMKSALQPYGSIYVRPADMARLAFVLPMAGDKHISRFYVFKEVMLLSLEPKNPMAGHIMAITDYQQTSVSGDTLPAPDVFWRQGTYTKLYLLGEQRLGPIMESLMPPFADFFYGMLNAGGDQ